MYNPPSPIKLLRKELKDLKSQIPRYSVEDMFQAQKRWKRRNRLIRLYEDAIKKLVKRTQ